MGLEASQGHRLLAEDLHGGVVLHHALLYEAVLSVGGVRVEGHIADEPNLHARFLEGGLHNVGDGEA
jgi:hypothetical protein